MLPLLRLLQDSFPSLVQVLQFALQTGSFFTSTGFHQFVSSLIDGLHCRFVSQNVILENLKRQKQPVTAGRCLIVAVW